MADQQNTTPVPPKPAPTPSTFKPSAAPTPQAASVPPAKPGESETVQRVEIVTASGPATTPETAAPDGTNPSQYPADGTKLEGLMAGAGGVPLGVATPSAEVLNGNPPPYDAEAKHGLVEEPTASAGRLAVHCKMADLTEGKTVYKLGVSHPPYLVEAAGKGFAVLRSGTGGAVQISNDSEASFYTEDQSRQYAVADGNPNASGDVKHP